MMSDNQERPPIFEEAQEVVLTELQNFIDFMSQDFAVSKIGTVSQQLYFEIKARLKYVETLWDMYISSLKRIVEQNANTYFMVQKVDTNAYFEALGKAEMIVNRYNLIEGDRLAGDAAEKCCKLSL